MASSRFQKAFTDHPASVGETYGEHFKVAMHFSGQLLAASTKAFVHAIVPGMCCTSASEKVKALHGEMTTGARGEADAARQAAAAAAEIRAAS